MAESKYDDLEIKPRSRTPKENQYKARIEKLERRIHALEEKIQRDKKKKAKDKAEIILEYRRQQWDKQKDDFRIAQEDLIAKGLDVFFSRVKKDKIAKSAYVDAISGYPILLQYAKVNKIDEVKLCFLVTAYHYSWINNKEMRFYGYSYEKARSIITALVRSGHLVMLNRKKFQSNNNYTVTSKGMDVVESFHYYYKHQTNKMFAEFDRKHKYYLLKPRLNRNKEDFYAYLNRQKQKSEQQRN